MPSPRPSVVRRRAIGAALWISASCAGLGGLLVYGNTPGTVGAAPERWPSGAAIERAEGRPTLLMFAHPRCPCTRASLHELARLVAQTGGAWSGRVLFERPAGAPEGWERTDLWELAETIPGFVVETDPGGAVARAFGAETSGHVVAYDTDGALVFSGGVTASRGHEGDNRGRDALRSFANGGEALEHCTAVFGCPLRSPEEAP